MPRHDYLAARPDEYRQCSHWGFWRGYLSGPEHHQFREPDDVHRDHCPWSSVEYVVATCMYMANRLFLNGLIDESNLDRTADLYTSTNPGIWNCSNTPGVS